MWKLMALGTVSAVAAAMLLAVPAAVAHAEPFVLTLNGYFDAGASISGTAFVPNTPFTWSGVFDSTSPDLLPPLRGSVAYAPTSSTLTVGGVSYDVAPYSPARPTGITVGISDPSSPFEGGHYGVGFIQNPSLSGGDAALVGHWRTATPPFAVSDLTPSALAGSDLFGVGSYTGPCASGQLSLECARVPTPIPLSLDGVAYALTLGSVRA